MHDILEMIRLLSKTYNFLVQEKYVDFGIDPRTEGHELWSEIHKILHKNDNEETSNLAIWLNYEEFKHENSKKEK